MAGWDVSRLDLRAEAHFGDRVVLCRSRRPNDLHAMLREGAERSPAGDALIAGDLRLSWRSLEAFVEEVASGLHRLGLRQGDRIALFLGNRPEFVVALYAAARLGAIAVPIGTREQAPGVAYILNHSGAKFMLYDYALADRLPSRADVPALKASFGLAAEDARDALREFRTGEAAPAVSIGEEDVAAILYTSGTTGKPKGAMVTHLNIVHAAMIYEHTMALGPGERSIVAVPMTHVTGITGMVAPMARCAGALIVMPQFRAESFLALAAAEKMTHSVLVPAMYNLCLKRADFSKYDLSSWRVGAYGGAPMPAPTIEELAKALPELGLMNLYGSTETVVPQAIMPAGFALERREDVGLAVPGGEVVVMDASGRQLPAGEVGELWMRNATVVRGYWNDPEATAKNIVAGFWRSGDLGSIDADGFIRVLDRIKDMINRGGFKIYTAEVESVLAEHPAVLESAVVSKPCAVLGERVHAFVSLRDAAIRADELAAFCAARLADYKRPESFTISCEPLPRNANGKLMKRELRVTLLDRVE